MEIKFVGLVVYLHNLLILVSTEAPIQVQTHYEAVTSFDPPVMFDLNSSLKLHLLFHCFHATLQAPYTLAFLPISWIKKSLAALFS